MVLGFWFGGLVQGLVLPGKRSLLGVLQVVQWGVWLG